MKKNIINKNNTLDIPLKIFTWHIHGNYLYYLTQTNCEFYIPYNDKRSAGYVGKTKGFFWGKNVHEIPVTKVKETNFDLILFQSNYGSKNHYLEDQYEIFSQKQRELPKIYLEHDPPREHPTDTKHIVNDKEMLLVHVTHFNELMWDNNETPTKVIEHGVIIPDTVSYSGEKNKGIVMINNLEIRGRRLGLDIFQKVQKKIPLDLIGMGSNKLGGLGEIPHEKLPEFISHYRFFFNPIRYTSLGLSVCEAMMIGLPIIGLSTTEIPTIIKNDISGYTDTDINRLINKIQLLLENPQKAHILSQRARKIAREKFGIKKFTKEWERTFKTHIVKQYHQKQQIMFKPSNSSLSIPVR